MDTDHELLTLAATQHGLVRVSQASQLGALAAYRRLRRRGLTVPVSPTVVRVCGAPETVLQKAMAAVLDAGDGAVLSHTSAAALWRLPGFRLDPHHATLARSAPRHPSPVAIVHQPWVLMPEHIRMIDGIPVTTPDRTLFDLAGQRGVHAGRVERALDTAWAEGLVSWRGLAHRLTELAQRGRPGIRLMRSLLDARGPDYRPAGSNTERRFQSLMARAGLSGFERQVSLGDDEEWIGRIDFVHRPSAVLVEVDDDRWHGALLDRAADERRDRRLRAAGWCVVRVPAHDVWHQPDNVIARVVAVVDERLHRGAA